MNNVKVKMKKERHCKHSVVYKALSTLTKNGNAFISVYLMNAAYKALGEPDDIIVIIEKG